MIHKANYKYMIIRANKFSINLKEGFRVSEQGMLYCAHKEANYVK